MAMVMPRSALLWRFVNLVKGDVVRHLGVRQYFGDGGGQRRLAVVNVSNRPHVHMGLRSLKFLLRHFLKLAPFAIVPAIQIPMSFV